MPRTVFCRKLQKEAEGLDEPPLAGPLGREVFEHVSREAWTEWSELSVKIVNEYHLDLAEKEHRKVLRDQLRGFLALDGEGGAKLMDVGTPTEEAGAEPTGAQPEESSSSESASSGPVSSETPSDGEDGP